MFDGRLVQEIGRVNSTQYKSTRQYKVRDYQDKICLLSCEDRYNMNLWK